MRNLTADHLINKYLVVFEAAEQVDMGRVTGLSKENFELFMRYRTEAVEKLLLKENTDNNHILRLALTQQKL